MKILIRFAVLTALLVSVAVCNAEVDFKIQKQLKLDSTPLDIKLAVSGRWLYVLTQNGHLRVYSHQGAFIGSIVVDTDIDQIEPGPTDEEIYLKSSRQKSIQVVEVTYNHAIFINGAPYKGAPDAPIVIVEYTDFQCPYCARLVPTFSELLKRYPKEIKIVYKNYPLRGHPYAKKAAAAAMAAHQKGKFWEFHDRLFANHYRMNDEVIATIRKEMGLESAEFDALMTSPKIDRMIQQDIRQGQSIGVNSTPSVFINGVVQKDKRLEGFIETIEQELKALK
jgi:protein-disulfide isomerase